MTDFKQTLAQGKLIETLIAKWLIKRGYTIIPIYEIADNQYKGPQIFTPHESIIAPDMLAFKDGYFYFIEAKFKSGFTKHDNTGHYLTGIDLPHYRNYIKVMEHFNTDIRIIFVMEGKEVMGNTWNSGVYMGYLSEMVDCIHHTHEKGSKHGMVYWDEEVLTKVCTLEQFYNKINS